MTDINTAADVYSRYANVSVFKEIFYDWGGLNVALFRFINGIRDDGYDEWMQRITMLGDHHYFLPILTLIAFYAVLTSGMRFLCRYGNVRHYFTTWCSIMLVFTASYIITFELATMIKDYLAYPRPYAILDPPPFVLEHRGASEAIRSFPSGHAAFIATLLISLWPVLSFNFRTIGVILVLLVCWSRISLGVHFPADVLGGALLALCIVPVVRLAVQKILGIFKLYS